MRLPVVIASLVSFVSIEGDRNDVIGLSDVQNGDGDHERFDWVRFARG